jgi:ribonuclease P protein component
MLPKKERVTKEIFQNILKVGKFFSTSLFTFYYLQNQGSRYSFVAPKKIFKTAVIRNKYRRLGYNILRRLPIDLGYGIFMYKKQALFANKNEIEQDINFILKKVNFIKKDNV